MTPHLTSYGPQTSPPLPYLGGNQNINLAVIAVVTASSVSWRWVAMLPCRLSNCPFCPRTIVLPLPGQSECHMEELGSWQLRLQWPWRPTRCHRDRRVTSAACEEQEMQNSADARLHSLLGASTSKQGWRPPATDGWAERVCKYQGPCTRWPETV